MTKNHTTPVRHQHNKDHHTLYIHKLKNEFKTASKQKHRKGGSHTKTCEDHEKQNDSIENPGSIGAAHMTIVVKKNRPKHLIGTEQVLYAGYGGSVNTTNGGQVSADILCIGSAAQWLDSITTPTHTQSVVRYFDMNPGRGLTGSGAITAGNPSTDRYCMLKSYLNLDITNVSSISAQVELVVYKCRKLTNLIPTDLSNGTLVGFQAYPSLVTPVDATRPAGGSGAYGTLGAIRTTFPYATASMPEGTRQFYSVLKRRQMLIGPGSTENVTMKFILNKIGKSDTMLQCRSQLANGDTFLPNTTVFVQLRVLGAVVKDTAVGTYGGGVHGQTELVYVGTFKHHFIAVPENSSREPILLGFTQEPAGGAVVPKFVNLFTNAVVAPLQG